MIRCFNGISLINMEAYTITETPARQRSKMYLKRLRVNFSVSFCLDAPFSIGRSAEALLQAILMTLFTQTATGP